MGWWCAARATRARMVPERPPPTRAVRHTMVSLDVAPRTLDDETQQYVRATLCITLDGDYPANPPTVRLSNVRGLDDTRQAEVRRRLDDACRDSSDEPVLALLCETAFETLTELNRPTLTRVLASSRWRTRTRASTKAPPCRSSSSCGVTTVSTKNCRRRGWWRWRAAAARRGERRAGFAPRGRERVGARTRLRDATLVTCAQSRHRGRGRAARQAGRRRDPRAAAKNPASARRAAAPPPPRARNGRGGALAAAMAEQRAKGGLIEEGRARGRLHAGRARVVAPALHTLRPARRDRPFRADGRGPPAAA